MDAGRHELEALDALASAAAAQEGFAGDTVRDDAATVLPTGGRNANGRSRTPQAVDLEWQTAYQPEHGYATLSARTTAHAAHTEEPSAGGDASLARQVTGWPEASGGVSCMPASLQWAHESVAHAAETLASLIGPGCTRDSEAPEGEDGRMAAAAAALLRCGFGAAAAAGAPRRGEPSPTRDRASSTTGSSTTNDKDSVDSGSAPARQEPALTLAPASGRLPASDPAGMFRTEPTAAQPEDARLRDPTSAGSVATGMTHLLGLANLGRLAAGGPAAPPELHAALGKRKRAAAGRGAGAGAGAGAGVLDSMPWLPGRVRDILLHEVRRMAGFRRALADPATLEFGVVGRARARIAQICADLEPPSADSREPEPGSIAHVACQVVDILIVMRHDEEAPSDLQDYTLVAAVAAAAHLLRRPIGDHYGLRRLADTHQHALSSLDQVFWHILTRLSYYRELHLRSQAADEAGPAPPSDQPLLQLDQGAMLAHQDAVHRQGMRRMGVHAELGLGGFAQQGLGFSAQPGPGGFAQPGPGGFAQPGFVQPGPDGHAQLGFAQPGLGGFAQPGFTQPGFTQPGLAQPGPGGFTELALDVAGAGRLAEPGLDAFVASMSGASGAGAGAAELLGSQPGVEAASAPLGLSGLEGGPGPPGRLDGEAARHALALVRECQEQLGVLEHTHNMKVQQIRRAFEEFVEVVRSRSQDVIDAERRGYEETRAAIVRRMAAATQLLQAPAQGPSQAEQQQLASADSERNRAAPPWPEAAAASGVVAPQQRAARPGAGAASGRSALKRPAQGRAAEPPPGPHRLAPDVLAPPRPPPGHADLSGPGTAAP